MSEDGVTGSCPVRRQVWGRRQGPGLKPNRRKLLEDRLPHLQITLPDRGPLDPAVLFSHPMLGFRLEIGFGSGEHLAAQAHAHPDLGFVGVEPFLNGVAKLVAEVDARHLTNVRILADDARLLLRVLADGCLQRLDVLFPDPWPKLRHHKRRIVNRQTVADMARVLEPQGELRLATDIPDYIHWMFDAACSERRLSWMAERTDDWRLPPADHFPTRYQRKARLEGRVATFLRFRRD